MPPASGAAPTHDAHGRCNRHWVYDLDCDDFDDLRRRADDRCELCGVAGLATGHRMLHIDHEGPRGPNCRVRGLLCCSRTITDHELSYLGHPFWARDSLVLAREERAATGLILHRLARRPRGAESRQFFFVDSPLWAALRAPAMAAGTPRSALIQQFVRWYLTEPGAQLPQRPDREGRSS